MSCYLCGSKNFREILNKQETYVYMNIPDDVTDKKARYKCIINQCGDCGHVYQPMSDELRRVLREIYLSDIASGSTPMGKGNWGLKRCNSFLGKMDLKNCKSAIEIGCADGYVLKCLKKHGLKKLVGIDPSINKTEEVDGILLLKDFANEKLILPQKYELIFSNVVMEHIENINSLMKFCRYNLAENGKIFFTVPNGQKQLEDGDPGLFLHQHIHYYTESSLRYLLSKHGFCVTSILSTKDALGVSAQITKNGETKIDTEITFYDDYQKKMERVLAKVERILQGNKVIVHGANNALNNILGFLGRNFDFVLVDNDRIKQAKRYFNKIVRSISDIQLGNYDTVLIIPTSFYEEIKADYIKKGFKGKIENILQTEESLKCQKCL